MKRVFLILFLSLMVTGIGIDDVYAAKPKAKTAKKQKKVIRPTTSKIKKKDEKKKTETAEQKKKRLAKEKADTLKNKKDITKTKSLTRSDSKSTIKKKGEDKTVAPKLNATQQSAVDKKLKRHKALKGKTFKSKKEAETAYRKSLATQKYDKKPDQRPNNIPDYYEHNGRRVETDYYEGQFGVYTSPGIFRPYGPMDFIVDALVINALTTPHVQTVPVQTAPVVVDRKPTNENDTKIVLYVLMFIGFIVVVVIVLVILKAKGVF